MSGIAEVNVYQHRAIVVVDVARFTDPARTEHHQRAVHEGLYDLLRVAFDEAGVRWKDCRVDDRGDGAIIYVRPEFPKIWLVDQLPPRLLAGIWRHNHKHAAGASMQLRVALNAGEVYENPNGIVSQAVNHTCRLVDAPSAKEALARTRGALALIASDTFYQQIIRNEPGAAPDSYHRIPVSVKETHTHAWLRLPEGGAPDIPMAGKVGLFDLVDALLAVPVMADANGRRLVLDLLRPEIAAAVPDNPSARLHVVSLVRTCLLFEGGIAELVAAVSDLAGDCVPVRRLVEISGKWLSGQV